MQERKIVVFSEDEWNNGKFRTSTWYAADTILVKLDGADYLYRVAKSRHTGNAGKIVRMEIM